MVDLTGWETTVKEMAEFYTDLESAVTHDADKFYAQMAKESSVKIVQLLEVYKSKPHSQYMKQIHANLMTLTRGVEGFIDPSADMKHSKYGALQHDLLEFIRKNVRW